MTTPLAQAVKRLAEILHAENRILSSLDFHEIGYIVSDKRFALDKLSHCMAGSANLPPSSNTDLTLRIRELQILADENKRLLERAITVQNRVMAVVARAAQQTQVVAGYGSKGTQPRASTAYAFALATRA